MPFKYLKHKIVEDMHVLVYFRACMYICVLMLLETMVEIGIKLTCMSFLYNSEYFFIDSCEEASRTRLCRAITRWS